MYCSSTIVGVAAVVAAVTQLDRYPGLDRERGRVEAGMKGSCLKHYKYHARGISALILWVY